MSASDPILWLDINLSKILLATLNPKNSYYNYILVVYVYVICYISKMYNVLLVLLNQFHANSWSMLNAVIKFFSKKY